jgi:hypothetical protein
MAGETDVLATIVRSTVLRKHRGESMILALLVSAALAAAPIATSTPGCWELFLYPVNVSWLTHAEDDAQAARLKTISERGWELVAVASNIEDNHWHTLYFKRRVACPTPVPVRSKR